MKRYSTRDFPPYKFLPGKATHPEKEGGYLFENKIEFAIVEDDLVVNADFLYAYDLYNHKYFWESHVYFEGLWQQIRKSNIDAEILLKGLIKLGAAGVKDELDSPSAATGHLKRAIELFEKIADKTVLNIKIKPIYDYAIESSFPLDLLPVLEIS